MKIQPNQVYVDSRFQIDYFEITGAAVVITGVNSEKGEAVGYDTTGELTRNLPSIVLVGKEIPGEGRGLYETESDFLNEHRLATPLEVHAIRSFHEKHRDNLTKLIEQLSSSANFRQSQPDSFTREVQAEAFRPENIHSGQPIPRDVGD